MFRTATSPSLARRGRVAQVGWHLYHPPSPSHRYGTPYVENQEEHHRIQTFDDEYKAFPDRHDIEYDDRFAFG